MANINETELQDSGDLEVRKKAYRSEVIALIIAIIIMDLLFIIPYPQIIFIVCILAFTTTLGVIIYFLLNRNYTKYLDPTKFFISDDGMRILIPRTKPFEIKWAEIGDFKLTVIVGSYNDSDSAFSEHLKLVMTFFTGEPRRRNAFKKVGITLFHDDAIKKIVNSIVNLAKNLKKETVIDKYTQEFCEL